MSSTRPDNAPSSSGEKKRPSLDEEVVASAPISAQVCKSSTETNEKPLRHDKKKSKTNTVPDIASSLSSTIPSNLPSFSGEGKQAPEMEGVARAPIPAEACKSSAAAVAHKPAAEKKKPAPRKASKPKAKKKVEDRKKWPRVKYGDWQYVYICSGPFEGRFGYYDDHEGSALVYFGAPCVGDGPYSIPLNYLRKPPAKYCKNVFVAM